MSSIYGDALAEVLQRVIKMIFGVESRLVERRFEDDKSAPYEVSGIIGITGSARGNIVLSFPSDVARQLTALMLSEKNSKGCTQQDVSDCVGEISNIVAGNLLTLLDEHIAATSQISLPSVIIGRHRVVWGSKDSPCDLMLFESKLGTFAAETNVRDVNCLQEGEERVPDSAR
jgi:chemotaxis protein CheX